MDGWMHKVFLLGFWLVGSLDGWLVGWFIRSFVQAEEIIKTKSTESQLETNVWQAVRYGTFFIAFFIFVPSPGWHGRACCRLSYVLSLAVFTLFGVFCVYFFIVFLLLHFFLDLPVVASGWFLCDAAKLSLLLSLHFFCSSCCSFFVFVLFFFSDIVAGGYPV